MDAADIVDVVKDYVTLRKAGVNLKGLCPFHNEKTPSFVVSPTKQLCKCFGCGKGGNAVHFLMEIEQLTYPEAIKTLAKKYGIEVKEKELSAEEQKSISMRESMLVLNEWACSYFSNLLHESKDGQAIGLSYLRQRGLRDDIIQKFHLGYSSPSRDALAQTALNKGYSKDLLVQTGLCFETDNHQLRDRYHDRIIFPIHSVSGRVIGFGGRIMQQNKNVGKYINSPESVIYDKSRELYGLYFAKKAIVKEDACYLVEGYMDVIAMHQSGIENVVASSGTSLTEGQIRLLHRFTSNIVVLYDGDAAGIHASLRGIDLLLKEGLNIKVLTLPNGEDPDSFARKHSAESFRAYLQAEAVDFIRFKAAMLIKETADDPIKRSESVSDIIRSIAIVPNGITRQTYARECAKLMDIDEQLILSEAAKIRKEERIKGTDRQQNNAGSPQKTTSIAESINTLTLKAGEEQERALIREIICVGEQKLRFANKHGETEEKSIIAFIAEDLAADNIKLQNPLHQKIIDEAQKEVAQKDFVARDYFINHPDADINALAMQLTTASEKLTKAEIEHEKGLQETVVHILLEYKYRFFKNELKKIEEEMTKLMQAKDYENCRSLMEQHKIYAEILKSLGNAVGGIVIQPF